VEVEEFEHGDEGGMGVDMEVPGGVGTVEVYIVASCCGFSN
jgi:hypothetical protein